MKKTKKSVLLSLLIGITAIYPIKSLQAFSIDESFLISQSMNQNVRSFFETGRLSSEDRLMFRRPPSGVIPPRENSQSWQFIVFKEGNVSFWMPPGALTQESITLNSELGDLTFQTMSSRSEDRNFVAAYLPSLTEEQIKRPQAILQAIQDKVSPNKEFKLINRQSITLNDFPGVELTFEGKIDNIMVRAYLVRDKVYVLGVRYPKENPQERQNRAFLNALQLLPSS